MTSEKLSERLRDWMPPFNDDDDWQYQADVSTFAEMAESLEAENQKLKKDVEKWEYKYNYEYQWHQTDNQRIRDTESRLSEAKGLMQKWRENPELIWGMSGLNGCADELEEALK